MKGNGVIPSATISQQDDCYLDMLYVYDKKLGFKI